MTGYPSKKAAAQDKLDDDDLTIAYQSGYYDGKKAAQPAQEPVGKFAKFTDGIWREVTDGSAGVPLYATPPQPALEQNFCPRCGKRAKDIHTCTPPQENT